MMDMFGIYDCVQYHSSEVGITVVQGGVLPHYDNEEMEKIKINYLN